MSEVKKRKKEKKKGVCLSFYPLFLHLAFLPRKYLPLTFLPLSSSGILTFYRDIFPSSILYVTLLPGNVT